VLIASCKAPSWPTEKFIKKYHYEEIKGDQSSQLKISDSCRFTARYPMYPDGLKGIRDHMMEHTQYPNEALNKNIKGVVLLSYVIEIDGSVDEVQILESVNPLLDNEAITVIKSMKRWIPGICDGKISRFEYRQPFNFSIK